MNENNNNNNSDDVASPINAASFDSMNKPLISTQIMNPVMSSTPSMSNDVLNTITEIETKEHDAIIDY